MANRHTLRKKMAQSQSVRDKIQASLLVNRLTDCATGKIELSPTQVSCIKILIDKVLPNLQATALTGADGGPIEHVSRLDTSALSRQQLEAIASIRVLDEQDTPISRDEMN